MRSAACWKPLPESVAAFNDGCEQIRVQRSCCTCQPASCVGDLGLLIHRGQLALPPSAVPAMRNPQLMSLPASPLRRPAIKANA